MHRRILLLTTMKLFVATTTLPPRGLLSLPLCNRAPHAPSCGDPCILLKAGQFCPPQRIYSWVHPSSPQHLSQLLLTQLLFLPLFTNTAAAQPFLSSQFLSLCTPSLWATSVQVLAKSLSLCTPELWATSVQVQISTFPPPQPIFLALPLVPRAGQYF